MELGIKQEKTFNYIELGTGNNILLLLHGLFGALSNWEHVAKQFANRYKIIIPLIPIYEIHLKKANLEGLVSFVEAFVEFKQLTSFTLMGNSLGGHISLIYTLRHPEKVTKLILTGSSGLYENNMGGSFIKRGNYDYIAERVKYTFYDPDVVSQAYIDEVFQVAQDNKKTLRIVSIAKSAQRNNISAQLCHIQTPSLLIWGLNDTITPPLVAHEFNILLANSQLRFIDRCCHAPMMEHPEKFNAILEDFI